jgi:hypothetical protein
MRILSLKLMNSLLLSRRRGVRDGAQRRPRQRVQLALHQASTVYLVAEKSRTLELLAFDEYCRFDTSAFF